MSSRKMQEQNKSKFDNHCLLVKLKMGSMHVSMVTVDAGRRMLFDAPPIEHRWLVHIDFLEGVVSYVGSINEESFKSMVDEILEKGLLPPSKLAEELVDKMGVHPDVNWMRNSD